MKLSIPPTSVVRRLFKLTLILLFFVNPSDAGHKLTKKIIGGKITQWEEYQFMASIVTRIDFKSVRLCGGSIINSRWILTAAHCVNEVKANAVNVYVGSTTFAGGVHYQAKKLILHRGYDGQNNDIALIQLNKPVTFGAGKKIRLNTKDIPDGTQATLVGWGFLSTHQDVTDIPPLHSVQLLVAKCQQATLIDILLPNNRFGFGDDEQNDNIICTSTVDGKGACIGDSGGPLVVNSIQVGIVSMGTPCATGTPDIYTKVQAYVGWIEEQTGVRFRI